MPRQLVRAAAHDRNRSLGWLALAWMEALTVHGPGDVQGMLVRHTDEYSGFVVDCYALERSGRLLYDSAFLSRPKGADKSGMGARFAMFEALGPCRFAGWAKGGELYEDPWGLGFRYVYEPGEPMGRHVNVPYIRVMATEEGQTGNVYDTIHYNLTDSDAPLSQISGIDAGITRIYLPGGGEITPSTASSSAKDGGKETFVVFDETHLYNMPELRRMYATVARNMRKRKAIAGTWYLETTTMFAPGEDSVAEQTYLLAEAIDEKKPKKSRLLYDHRWGECENLDDAKALRKAITEAYGDALAWNDLDGIIDEFHDTRALISDSRRFFLNAPTAAGDSWVFPHEWEARQDLTKVILPKDAVVLGFDGSLGRKRGKADATALIGVRVRDGHLFQIEVWEQPDGAAGMNWEVPAAAVDAEVHSAFRKYNVVGFYADPAKWGTYTAAWEARYGAKLKVKATAKHPIQFGMTGQRSVRASEAVEHLHDAIVDGEMTQDGSGALTRHVINARNSSNKARGRSIRKDGTDSPRKIDAAVAASLAWECHLDALAAGLGKEKAGAVRRIR